MSKKMSSWRSYHWHQRFGYPKQEGPLKGVQDILRPVEAPAKRDPVRQEPMHHQVRLEHYLTQHDSIVNLNERLTSPVSVQLMHLTSAQRKRWRKKVNHQIAVERRRKHG
jgi:hypothetical protein